MRSVRRRLVWSAAGYGAALFGVLVLGLALFGDLCRAPAPEPGTEFAPSYRLFLTLGGGILAVGLVALSAMVGTVTRRWWLGLGGLCVGLMATIAVLSLLPWVRYPHDQYAAGAAWAFVWVPASLGSWLLVTGVGLLKRPRHA